MSNKIQTPDYYRFSEQEKSLFNDFLQGLAQRGFAGIVKRMSYEYSNAYDTFNTYPFLTWLFESFKQRGAEFLRKLGRDLEFTKQSFPVVYDYIQRSYFSPLFFGGLPEPKMNVPVSSETQRQIQMETPWQTSLNYFVNVSKPGTKLGTLFLGYVKQSEAGFMKDPVFSGFLREVEDPLQDFLTRISGAHLVFDAYLIKSGQRSTFSETAMLKSPSISWEETLNQAADQIHRENSLETFVTYRDPQVDQRALDLTYHEIFKSVLTTRDIALIYAENNMSRAMVTAYNYATIDDSIQLLDEHTMEYPKLKTAFIKFFIQRGIETAVDIFELVAQAKQTYILTTVPSTAPQRPAVVAAAAAAATAAAAAATAAASADELSRYLQDWEISQSTIDYFIEQKITMTKFKRWPYEVVLDVLKNSEVPLAERGDILAAKKALDSSSK